MPDPSGKPTVLFLCVHNAGRSQMALAFFQHLAGDAAIALSGGSNPTDTVNPTAIAAMAERGIDISHASPQPWTTQTIEAADLIITMGCNDSCPILPAKRYLDWPIPDPANKPLNEVRPIRDTIEHHVRTLLADLGIPAPTQQ